MFYRTTHVIFVFCHLKQAFAQRSMILIIAVCTNICTMLQLFKDVQLCCIFRTIIQTVGLITGSLPAVGGHMSKAQLPTSQPQV